MAPALADPTDPGSFLALVRSRTFKRGVRLVALSKTLTQGTPRRTPWIVPPPELCVLCRKPLSPGQESSWNGSPAHRECVKIHLLNRDPAFRDWSAEAPDEAPEEALDELVAREDDDESPDG